MSEEAAEAIYLSTKFVPATVPVFLVPHCQIDTEELTYLRVVMWACYEVGGDIKTDPMVVDQYEGCMLGRLYSDEYSLLTEEELLKAVKLANSGTMPDEFKTKAKDDAK